MLEFLETQYISAELVAGAVMDVIMPQLGETVTEGKVAAWFKSVGDQGRRPARICFEIETDKVTMEVQATESGILVGDPRRRRRDGSGRHRGRGARRRRGAAAKAKRRRSRTGNSGAAHARPFAEVRTPDAILWPGRRAAGTQGDAAGAAAHRRRRAATSPPSPQSVRAQRRAAHRRGRYAERRRCGRGAAAPPRAAKSQPLNRIRAQTAARLAEAWRTHSACLSGGGDRFLRGRARARRGKRANLPTRHGVALTYLPFVARAVCLALAEFPRVNAAFDKDRLRLHRDVNLGIAVDLAHEGLDRAGGAACRRDDGGAASPRPSRARSRRRATNKLTPGRSRGRHLYDLEQWQLRHALHHADHQSAAGRDPVARRGDASAPSWSRRRKATPSPRGRSAIVGQSFDHRAFDGAYSAAFLKRLKAIIETRDWASELA